MLNEFVPTRYEARRFTATAVNRGTDICIVAFEFSIKLCLS